MQRLYGTGLHLLQEQQNAPSAKPCRLIVFGSKLVGLGQEQYVMVAWR